MGSVPQVGQVPSSRMTAAMLRLCVSGMPAKEAFSRCPRGQIAWIFNVIVVSL
jgi:hypothetical protein